MVVSVSGSPTALHRAADTSGSVTSVSFTPPDASYILVMIGWHWRDTTGGGVFSVNDNIGNTYESLQELAYGPGTSSFINLGYFGHYYVSSPGPITVTASNTRTNLAAAHFSPRVLLGANPDQSGTVRGPVSGGGISYGPAYVGSLAFVIGAALSSITAPLYSGMTTIDNWAESTATTLFARTSNPSPDTSTQVVGWTGSNVEYSLIVEVRPFVPLVLSGSSTTVSHANGTISAQRLISALSNSVSQANGTIGLRGIISGSSSTVSSGDGGLRIPITFNVNGVASSASWAGGLFTQVIPINSLTYHRSIGFGSIKAPDPYKPPPSGSQDYVWVEILDNNLVSRGPIQFVTLSAQLYYNAVGSWSMVVPYTDDLWNLMMAGDFFVNINWRGLFTFGGKCEKPGYQDSIPGSTGGSGSFPGPFITLSGADYLAVIANRIVYPNPAQPWSGQTVAVSDAVSGVRLETAIKHYVNNNVGPGALAARRVTPLTIAADLGRGPTISLNVKFGSGMTLDLFEIIRKLLANANIQMGISIVRNPTAHTLIFDVYIPRDLRNKCWFSESLGNLTSVNFSLDDPTATDALVYGGTTASPIFLTKTATSGSTQWTKAEQFIDGSGETDSNNLSATAQQAIFAGAPGPVMGVNVIDTPFLTFGRDYGLGDIVSVEIQPGDVFTDVVSSVTLTADPSQNPPISVVPTIGHSSEATDTDQTIIGQLIKRIRALEKKLAMK